MLLWPGELSGVKWRLVFSKTEPIAILDSMADGYFWLLGLTVTLYPWGQFGTYLGIYKGTQSYSRSCDVHNAASSARPVREA